MPSNNSKKTAACSVMLIGLALLAGPGARADLDVVWVGPVAQRAGIAPGDALRAWQAGDVAGELAAAGELWRVLNGPGRRSVVTLSGTRDGATRRWQLPADTQDVIALGASPSPAMARLGEQLSAAADGSVESAVSQHIGAPVEDGQLVPDLWLAQWLGAQTTEWPGAGDLAAQVLDRWADRALPIDLAGLSWRLARGELLVAQGEFDLAADVFAPLATEADLAMPLDIAVVASLIDNARGDMAAQQGDLSSARSHYERALARLAAAPSSAAAADSRRDLGTTYAMGGDMASAEYHYVDALAIDTRAQRDTGRARTLNNLGIVAVRRGDIAGAERYYQDALVLNESLGRWRSYATNLFNLADLAVVRGDNDTALALLQRARAQFAADEPGGFRELQTRLSIANMQLELENPDEAQKGYRFLLNAYEALAPGNEQVAGVYLGLGDVARLRGDLSEAQRQLETALKLRVAAAPGSVAVAEAHEHLARFFADNDDRNDARRHLDAARDIYRRESPEAVAHADVLFALAKWYARAGQDDAVIATLEEALAVLDGQTRLLGGGDDARALFADRNAPLYRMLIDRLVAAGELTRAFDVLERYRARSMLGLIAQRDQSYAAAVDADRAAREAATRAYDRAQDRLSVALADGASQARIATLRAKLAERRALRDSAMRFEAASMPETDPTARVSLDEAREMLPAGTLALSFLVDDEHTYVFALTRSGLTVDHVAVKRARLEADVSRLRAQIAAGRRDAAPAPALRDTGSGLFDTLLRAAVERVDAGRLLIIADGPLHHLPFAALTVRDLGDDAFAVERWPIRRALSLTLLARHGACDAGGCAPRTGPVAAFAAPDAGPQQLAFAGRELAAVERVYGDRTRRFEGSQATEQRVLSEAGGADILHFATHATLAAGLPLDSALILHPETIGDNGSLQVWEIFEQLRTSARLVTLSACESAQGMETAGDGLIGLARAFRFAGARSVLATQWPVADRAGAFFVETLYRGIDSGEALDDAVRSAQLAMLRGRATSSGLARAIGRAEPVPPGASAPFYWAGYELSGHR